jgi:predicted secreted protein
MNANHPEYDPNDPNQVWYDDRPTPPSIFEAFIAALILAAIILALFYYIPFPPYQITRYKTG